MKNFYLFWMFFLALFFAGCSFGSQEKTDNCVDTNKGLCSIWEFSEQTIDWDKLGYRTSVPEGIQVKADQDKKLLTFSHATLYAEKQLDFCDMRGDEEVTGFQDFSLSIQDLGKIGLVAALKNDAYFDIMWIEVSGDVVILPDEGNGGLYKTTLGKYDAFALDLGVEYCGVTHYFILLESNNVFKVSSYWVPELNQEANPGYASLETLPGVLLPEVQQAYKEEIINWLESIE